MPWENKAEEASNWKYQQIFKKCWDEAESLENFTWLVVYSESVPSLRKSDLKSQSAGAVLSLVSYLPFSLTFDPTIKKRST